MGNFHQHLVRFFIYLAKKLTEQFLYPLISYARAARLHARAAHLIYFDQKTDADKSLGRPVTPSFDKALANLPIMIFTINFVARSKLTQIFNFQRIFI